MQGALSEGVLPGFLRDLYVGRKSGVAHFVRDSEQRNVGFRRGHISHASSNVSSDYLTAMLQRNGLLSAADHERCNARMVAEKKRLGEVLIELGLMTKDKVEESLALHVREILLKVFSWSDGSYSFEEQPDAELMGAEDVTQRLSTGELILEAVRRVQDSDVVRYALGDTNRVLQLSNDPLLRFQKIALSPVDGFLLSRVDGTISAHEAVELAPVATTDAERSLFGLLCTGVVEYLPGPPKKRYVKGSTGKFKALPSAAAAPAAASPAPPAAYTPPPAAVTPPAAEVVAARPQTTAPSPPPAPPPADDGKQGRRQEIVEMFDSLKTRTHFEILGIPRASNETQVKEAYFRLARRFHPDTQHDASLADLASQIEAVFIRIGQAYETLRNAKSRAQYEERLGSSRGGSMFQAPTAAQAGAASAATPPEPPPPPEPPQAKDPAAQAHLLAAAMKQAERLLLQEKFWDAIQALESFLTEPDLPKSKLTSRAQVLIAKAYLKNPKWVKRAEEELQKAVHGDANNAEAYFLLGGIYRTGGLKSRATTMYKKAVELKPDHDEAVFALNELGGGEATPPPQGGFLKKLFKKSDE